RHAAERVRTAGIVPGESGAARRARGPEYLYAARGSDRLECARPGRSGARLRIEVADAAARRRPGAARQRRGGGRRGRGRGRAGGGTPVEPAGIATARKHPRAGASAPRGPTAGAATLDRALRASGAVGATARGSAGLAARRAGRAAHDVVDAIG